MKKVILTLLLMISFQSFGCINLSSFNISSNASQSERDAFNADKLNIYRNFVVQGNNIQKNYTKSIQDAYNAGLNNADLQTRLNSLKSQNQRNIAQNCNVHISKLKSLQASYN